MIPLLQSFAQSLPQGSDLFIPLVPILSVLVWMGKTLFYSEHN
jgi:hypothetical protein